MGYGAILKWLARYWLHLLILGTVVLALGISHRWAWVHGGDSERAKSLARENKALTAAIAERDKAIADRNAAQRKADELAKLPAKVIERVRTNPSRCSIPAPVADAIRAQVRAVNDAIH